MRRAAHLQCGQAALHAVAADALVAHHRDARNAALEHRDGCRAAVHRLLGQVGDDRAVAGLSIQFLHGHRRLLEFGQSALAFVGRQRGVYRRCGQQRIARDAELLDVLNCKDPQVSDPPPEHYAVTLRSQKRPVRRSRIEGWYYPMTVGQPLAALPIWLDRELRVTLPLESSYEETCRLLHIK